MVWKLYHGTFVSLTDVKMVKTWTDQIKSNLFAQNTSHFNAASGKSSWWAGPTRLKRALTVTLKRQVKQILSTNNVFRLMDLSKFREIRASRWLLWHSDYIKFEFGRWVSLWCSPRHPSRLGKGIPPSRSPSHWRLRRRVAGSTPGNSKHIAAPLLKNSTTWFGLTNYSRYFNVWRRKALIRCRVHV